MRTVRTVLLVAAMLVVPSCSHALRSCAAHVIVMGPVLVTMSCPPPGYVFEESSPEGTATTRGGR